jgi:hypothetical protein
MIKLAPDILSQMITLAPDDEHLIQEDNISSLMIMSAPDDKISSGHFVPDDNISSR